MQTNHHKVAGLIERVTEMNLEYGAMVAEAVALNNGDRVPIFKALMTGEAAFTMKYLHLLLEIGQGARKPYEQKVAEACLDFIAAKAESPQIGPRHRQW